MGKNTGQKVEKNNFHRPEIGIKTAMALASGNKQ